jgi:hypothetical protein
MFFAALPTDYQEPSIVECVYFIDQKDELIHCYKKFISPLDKAISNIYNEMCISDNEECYKIYETLLQAKKDLIYALGLETLKSSDLDIYVKDVSQSDEDEDYGW